MQITSEDETQTRELDLVEIEIVDTISPTLTLISPMDEALIDGDFVIEATVYDGGSGVAYVNFKMDDQAWQDLSLIDDETGAYSSTWSPDWTQNGEHFICVQAFDIAGNASLPVTHSIEIDMFTPFESLEGAIEPEFDPIDMGDVQTLHFTLTNNMEWEINDLLMRAVVSDASSQQIVASMEQTDNVGANSAVEGSFDLSTSALDLASYNVALEVENSETGEVRSLAATSFTVSDVTAPSLEIASPLDGSIQDGAFAISATASDSGTGVDYVEYRVDGGAWTSLPLADASAGLYSLTWDPADSEQGAHVIEYRGYDLAGNESDIASVSIQIILYPPFDLLTGALTLASDSVDEGADQTCGITVNNPGYLSAEGVIVRVSVSDPDTSEVKATYELTRDFASLASWSDNFIFNTATYSIKSYDVALEIEDSETGEVRSLAATSFTVLDVTAPTLEIASPLDGSIQDGAFAISATASDSGTGVDYVEYRVDGGAWTSLPLADASASLYSLTWDPADSEQGAHVIEYRGYDLAGNESDIASVSIQIILYPPFDLLTGSLTLASDSVDKGADQSCELTVNNPGCLSAEGVIVRVLVRDPGTLEIQDSQELTRDFDSMAAWSGKFQFDTTDYLAQVYEAVLEIEEADSGSIRVLDAAGFEVLPAITVEKIVSGGAVNLLVWVNDVCQSPLQKCEGGGGNPYDDCVRTDLLESILQESGVSYDMVYTRSEFEEELRNPVYTDIMILGDAEPISFLAGSELRERINSGTGVISSKWNKHYLSLGPQCWDGGSIFGVYWNGNIDADEVQTVASPITEEGVLPIYGDSEKLVESSSATVAGWIEKTYNSHWWWFGGFQYTASYPAIVLNEYGQGKTVYFAFDLGLSVRENNYEQMKALISNSIQYIHSAGTLSEVIPNQSVDVELRLEKEGAETQVTVSEEFPDGASIIDLESGQRITQSPWTFEVTVGSSSPAVARYVYIAPQAEGDYTFLTKVYMGRGTDSDPVETISTVVAVEKDFHAMATDILDALNSLSVSWHDESRVRGAVSLIEMYRNRTVAVKEDILYNLRDLSLAAGLIMLVDGDDASQIRLDIDGLLRSEEGRYYFFVPTGDYVFGILTAPETADVGDSVEFSYEIANAGDQDISNATLTLALAASKWEKHCLSTVIDLPASSAVSGVLMADTANWNPGNYETVMTIRADLIPESKELASIAFTLELAARPPVSDPGGPYLAVVGESVFVNGGASYDPDQGTSQDGEPPYDYITAYDWEVDMVEPYDFGEDNGETATLLGYVAAGEYQIALKVTDNTSLAFPDDGENLTHWDIGTVTVYPKGVDSFWGQYRRGGVELDWTRSGSSYYEILRSDKGPNHGFEMLSWAYGTWYKDYWAAKNKDYWYRIRTQQGGQALLSEPVHVQTGW